MLVLAFDTSTSHLSVALADPSGVLVERDVEAGNRHGELLAPNIEGVLAAAGVARTELSAVAVGTGPGPFTGLRVGIVTAAALADALRIPAYAECSLDLVDRGLEQRETVVMSDARRRRLYWARYSPAGRRIDGPELDLPADLAEGLSADRPLLVGDGAVLYRELFAGFDVVAGHPSARLLTAAVVERAASGAPGDALTPMYLRQPDARPPGAPKQVTPT